MRWVHIDDSLMNPSEDGPVKLKETWDGNSWTGGLFRIAAMRDEQACHALCAARYQ
jgi:hypothetical protein